MDDAFRRSSTAHKTHVKNVARRNDLEDLQLHHAVLKCVLKVFVLAQAAGDTKFKRGATGIRLVTGFAAEPTR